MTAPAAVTSALDEFLKALKKDPSDSILRAGSRIFSSSATSRSATRRG